MIHLQGHKVKVKTAITPPQITRFRSNSVEFVHGTASTLQIFKVKGQRSRSRGQNSRSQRNVTYKHEKRSKTATDRLSEFKLGTGDEIKADRDCAASGCLKLQCVSR